MVGKSSSDLFQIEEAPTHPRLRRWRNLKESGYSFELEIHRKWDGLTFSPTRMFVTVKASPTDIGGPPEEFLWEDELNQGLVDLGVQARDQDNEVVRYSFALRSAFAPVSLRHGQGYARSVLVEFLRKNRLAAPLVAHPKLSKMLEQIREDTPYHGADYDQATEAVESIVKSKALEITTKLKYTQDEAIDILSRALAQYLDEIFHVTARQFWFPKASSE